MVLGKKERKTVSLSGAVAEATGIEANILNYAKALISARVDVVGTYTVVLKVYGSTDIDDASMWKQIGTDITLTTTGVITPISVDSAYDALKLVYSGVGSGSAVLIINLVRKRH
jgi:hypothetical protein